MVVTTTRFMDGCHLVFHYNLLWIFLYPSFSWLFFFLCNIMIPAAPTQIRIIRNLVRSYVVSPVVRPLVAPSTAGCSATVGVAGVSTVLVAPSTAGVGVITAGAAAAGTGAGVMMVVVMVVVVVVVPPVAAVIVSTHSLRAIL